VDLEKVEQVYAKLLADVQASLDAKIKKHSAYVADPWEQADW